VLSLAVAIAAVVLAALAALSGLGVRWDWWSFRTGLTLFRWTAWGGVAVAAVSLSALIGALLKTRRGIPLAGFGLFVAVAVAAIPWRWQKLAQSVPAIHDISTDTENPPLFEAIKPLRAGSPNPSEYGGDAVALQQRKAYPDITPVFLRLPPSDAFARALSTAESLCWQIAAADPAAGRIEATDQTFWFGFKDDIVIRLTPHDGGVTLDVRSTSRVGRSDVGTNAKRIRAYLKKLQNNN